MDEYSRTVRIANRKGLHARASAKVAELASTYTCEVHLRFKKEVAPADSILNLLMLGAGMGSEVCVVAKGSDAEGAVDGICRLIEDKFGEPS